MRVSIALYGNQTFRLGIYFAMVMVLYGFVRENGWSGISIGCDGKQGVATFFRQFLMEKINLMPMAFEELYQKPKSVLNPRQLSDWAEAGRCWVGNSCRKRQSVYGVH
jgi:hypothetical protein